MTTAVIAALVFVFASATYCSYFAFRNKLQRYYNTGLIMGKYAATLDNQGVEKTDGE